MPYKGRELNIFVNNDGGWWSLIQLHSLFLLFISFRLLSSLTQIVASLTCWMWRRKKKERWKKLTAVIQTKTDTHTCRDRKNSKQQNSISCLNMKNWTITTETTTIALQQRRRHWHPNTGKFIYFLSFFVKRNDEYNFFLFLACTSKNVNCSYKCVLSFIWEEAAFENGSACFLLAFSLCNKRNKNYTHRFKFYTHIIINLQFFCFFSYLRASVFFFFFLPMNICPHFTFSIIYFIWHFSQFLFLVSIFLHVCIFDVFIYISVFLTCRCCCCCFQFFFDCCLKNIYHAYVCVPINFLS